MQIGEIEELYTRMPEAVREVVRRVADEFELDPLEVVSRRRTALIAGVRARVWAELYDRLGWSMNAIGKMFGRDHTSVRDALLRREQVDKGWRCPQCMQPFRRERDGDGWRPATERHDCPARTLVRYEEELARRQRIAQQQISHWQAELDMVESIRARLAEKTAERSNGR